MNIYSLSSLLGKLLNIAEECYKSDYGKKFFSDNLSAHQLEHITTIVNNAETQKSVLAVLITCLLKKIESPSQDVRLHREEFKDGYSGRGLDTNVVTPWLKEHFPKFAPKESGWLTRSIEQPHPFTKNFPGKIRNVNVKNAFLSILEDVEEKKSVAEKYLISMLILLLDKTEKELGIMEMITNVKSTGSITINLILEMLKEHFSMARSSRLPVIAIYSIYQILVKSVEIYKGKKLQPLKSHTTSDRYMGYGDIEVYYNDGTPFEIVEIKHKIPIDLITIKDVFKKVQTTSIKRYFILTTADPNFVGDEKEIFDILNGIKQKYNIDIIPNGIIASLKYYLRFLIDLNEFLNVYTENIKKEFSQTTDVKELHIKKWEELIKRYGVDK